MSMRRRRRRLAKGRRRAVRVLRRQLLAHSYYSWPFTPDERTHVIVDISDLWERTRQNETRLQSKAREGGRIMGLGA